MNRLILLGITALCAAAAQGGVTLNMANGVFYKNDGLTPLSINSTITLLADADNDGFGDLTQATNSWTADSGDILLGRWGLNEFLGGPGTSFDAISFNYAGLAAGEQMLLVWYDKPFGAADAGPGNDVFFGSFRSDSAISFSDIGWFVPADGATVNLNFLTSSFGGDTPESAGRAQFKSAPAVTAAIPSPSAAALGLVGFALIALKQRRQTN